MKVAVVGGGILGLTLAFRLGRAGHSVDLFEGENRIGGLACSHDYGPFVWDRFYHCILAQDTSLIRLLDELGIAGDLRWKNTGTGYFAAGQFHSMSSNRDFLRFPLLSLTQKARLGAAVLWATRVARPEKLYRVTAQDWLIRLCGREAYTVFWQPLLKAKFGPFHDQVAAVFIYATLLRLFGARSAAAGKENLGYVQGGYARILERFRERLLSQGTRIRTGTPVVSIEGSPAGTSPGSDPAGRCRVRYRSSPEGEAGETYDQVFFTGPTRLARKVASPEFPPHVEAVERAHPTSATYLGVACLVLILEQPLTSYYVLNIGDPAIELTGVIEMTNLIDPGVETGGLSLVYLPRYMDSESPGFQEGDQALRETLIERGVKRLFPGFDAGRARYMGIHRARYVQPLPLVRDASPSTDDLGLRIARPFQIVNTSMLRCATLNNNEVVALVDRIFEQNPELLEAGPGLGVPAPGA
jgi:protoporphyrinogen oxidase